MHTRYNHLAQLSSLCFMILKLLMELCVNFGKYTLAVSRSACHSNFAAMFLPDRFYTASYLRHCTTVVITSDESC